MNSLDELYNQYSILIENLQTDTSDETTTNLLQYNITPEYFEQVDRATGALMNFYNKYLNLPQILKTIEEKLHDNRKENIKFCLLVDVIRCYDGLNHPTTFNTPEGIAFMILLYKIFNAGEIMNYEQLKSVHSTTLSLINLIPYIGGLSTELGNSYSLFLSPILQNTSTKEDRIYRIIIYSLCKKIAEVDGVLSTSEEEWLNEIALLNDDDPDNDIDVSEI